VPSKAEASRVRAIYPFVTQERGELSFERGDVIKVIDRMYDEWYTGAVGGRIGIFPISYVVSRIVKRHLQPSSRSDHRPHLVQEPLPDPTPEELQREAQEEARVFAAQGTSWSTSLITAK
jgi:signal transducing adaptor molecule